MFNDSVLDSHTPVDFVSHLRVDNSINQSLEKDYHSQRYEEKIREGIKYAKTKKVVFVGLLRDRESIVSHIKNKVEELGKYFLSYKVLIVENDSKDDTRSLLLKWSKSNSNVKILGCGINAKVCRLGKKPTIGHTIDEERIQKMVDLRNIYLNEVKSMYSDHDYMMVWDFDLLSSVYTDGVMNSIGWLNDPNGKDIAQVCSNGIVRWPFLTYFYDAYATVRKNDTYHIDNFNLHSLKEKFFENSYYVGDDPEECESCFSGFSIYVIKYLLDSSVRYDMSLNDPDEYDKTRLECEHTRLNKKIKGKKMINPSMLHVILRNE